MPSTRRAVHLAKPYLLLTAIYFLASFGHFSHNAESICEYPNLPPWLTASKVYAAWAAQTSVGVLGLHQLRADKPGRGLALMAMYAALGLAGLDHYAVAPIQFHTLAANLSIFGEVIAAAALLIATLRAMLLT